jgi:hypothetical protein
MKKSLSLKLVALVAVLSAVPGVALAAAQDYSGVMTAITTEITGAMPTVLTVFGTLAAIGVGFRLLKRATRA